ncbi:hypothetical protein SAMD00023520_00072 [Listeria monocytogenes]|nr:hypothetical protein SAMD00023520_00072 [Listeria monocytogenes]
MNRAFLCQFAILFGLVLIKKLLCHLLSDLKLLFSP